MIFNVMKFGKSAKIEIPIPTLSNTMTYNGSSQQPIWNGLNTSIIEVKGNTHGINAGEYITTFHIIEPKLYMWTGGSTTDKSITWSIGRATVSSIPSQSGTLTYTGNYLSPSWSNFNSSQITLGGETSKINAGTYTAEFTPTDNYQWSDGSTTHKSVSWTINKAPGQVTLNPSTLNLTAANPTGTSTITVLGDGQILNKGTDNYNNLTWTITQTSITATATDTINGMSIVIGVSEGTNYLATTTTLTINSIFESILNTLSWSEINSYSQNGILQNYVAVGDTKSIEINGTVGNTIFSNVNIDAFIIGFNHNKTIEYPNGNITHFQIGKINNSLLSLVDSKYGTAVSEEGYFCMNSPRSNLGGWESSQMKTKIIGTTSKINTLAYALSSDLKSVMKKVIKYTDNTGNSSNSNSAVTSTDEDLCLLAEFEYNGIRKNANTYEKNKQKQYEYYSSGNSKNHKKYNNIDENCASWTRSPVYNDSMSFCFISDGTTEKNEYSYFSRGISPIFFV